MNAKIIPIFILLAAVVLSGAAPAVYAEEINEVVVVHEAPPRESSGPAIAPAPEQETGDDTAEPLIIAPGPLEAIAATEISDPNAGTPVVVMEEARPDKPIGGDRDEHECLGAAGYLWDQDKRACIRPWSGEIQENPVSHGGDPDIVTGLEPDVAEGGQETIEATALGPLEGLWQAIVDLFRGLFGWMF